MKINWKVRLSNPVFLVQLAVAVFAPVLAYFGLMWEDLTSWGAMIDLFVSAVKNPVVVVSVVVSVANAINDPTTVGLADSETARAYIKPN